MSADKKALRLKYRHIRREVINKMSLDKQMYDLFVCSSLYKNAERIMFYISMPQEPDTHSMIKQALADGKKVFVPKVISGTEMVACEIKGNEAYVKTSLGVYEPEKAQAYPEDKLDLIVVPGMAFSKNGTRLGFGGGFYDRFLANLDCNTVGLCYEACVADDLIKEETDINVKYIITEKEFISCGR